MICICEPRYEPKCEFIGRGQRVRAGLSLLGSRHQFTSAHHKTGVACPRVSPPQGPDPCVPPASSEAWFVPDGESSAAKYCKHVLHHAALCGTTKDAQRSLR